MQGECFQKVARSTLILLCLSGSRLSRRRILTAGRFELEERSCTVLTRSDSSAVEEDMDFEDEESSVEGVKT